MSLVVYVFINWFCIIISVCDDSFRILLQYSSSFTVAALTHGDQFINVISSLYVSLVVYVFICVIRSLCVYMCHLLFLCSYVSLVDWFCIIFQSVMTAIGFYYSTVLALQWQLLLMVISGTIGTFCFCGVEWMATRAHREGYRSI